MVPPRRLTPFDATYPARSVGLAAFFVEAIWYPVARFGCNER